MKKALSLAVVGAALALVSAAGAAITITPTQAGPGPQNLSPWNCSGHSYTASQPLRLGFGWFANNQGGLKQFFQNATGTVRITGSDTFNDSWSPNRSGVPPTSTQGITWTTGEPNTGITPGGQTVNGVAGAYRGLLSITPGTYTLYVGFTLAKTINDGWDQYSGTIDNGAGCTFTVGP